MATESRARSPAERLQGAARRNYEKLTRKLGLAGAPPPAPESSAAAPAPAAPRPMSASQATEVAARLMDLDFETFDAEARRLLQSGGRQAIRILASSRPDFEQEIDVLRKWARSSYASYLLREMTDDARWQVARLLNDRLLAWVELRSAAMADELRAIRREIGF